MMCFKNDDDTIWARSLKDDFTHSNTTLCALWFIGATTRRQRCLGDSIIQARYMGRQYHSSLIMRLHAPVAQLSKSIQIRGV
jgi:hypothetical protein